jgi:hypothetical protein
MTDVNVQFTLDCQGHAVLSLTNTHDTVFHAGYQTNNDMQGTLNIGPGEVGHKGFDVGANVHDISGTVSGTFEGGALPIWHPSNHFEAHNAAKCNIATTTTSSTLPGIVPGGSAPTAPPTTAPAPAPAPVAPVTVVPEPTIQHPVVSVPTTPAVTAVKHVTTTAVATQLPTTGGDTGGLVAGGMGALLLGALLVAKFGRACRTTNANN